MGNKGQVGLLVAALRSGLYEKGRRKLHRVEEVDGTEKHTWCCLGVGSDVALRFGLEGVERRMSPWTQSEMFNGNDSYMCREVMDWYGFEKGSPWLRTRAGAEDGDAAELNDGGEIVDRGSEDEYVTELDFATIAQY